MHTVTNTVMAYFGVGPGDVRAFYLVTALTWVAALLVVVLAGPRHLMRQENPAIEAALVLPAHATTSAAAMFRADSA